MENIVNYILVTIGLILFCVTVYHVVYTWYKDRQWRKNNPNEHDIMNQPVKRDKDW